MEKYLTRTATVADIKDIIEIHCRALPSDVVPNLTRRFMTSIYAELIGSPDLGQVVVAMRDNDVVGFVALGFRKWNLMSHLRVSDLLKFVIRSFGHPSLTVVAAAQLRMGAPNRIDESAEILFFGVHPQKQGSGVGRTILDEIHSILREKKINSIRTKTSNRRLVSFYISSYEARIENVFGLLSREYFELRWLLPRLTT